MAESAAVAVVAADEAGVAVGGDDGIGDGATADRAVIVLPYDAADAGIALNEGVGYVDVVDVGAVVNNSEETLIAVGRIVVVDFLTDTDASDGVAVAVEVAFEVVEAAVVSAYGLIVLRVVVAEGDVGSELKVLAGVIVGGLVVCAVHAEGQQLELGAVVDVVWV